jgi:hypothetical protein
VLCGGEELRSAAAALGLEESGTAAEAAIVDGNDDVCVRQALSLPASLPRVFVADTSRAALLRAAGVRHVLERPLSASALGPIVFALERALASTPRTILCCAASGATGRTSLVANLALRMAKRTPAVAVDATGTGTLAWRLGAVVAPWSDVAAVGPELGEGHLRLAAAEREGLLILGGPGVPDEVLLRRALDLALTLGTVFIDAPGYRPSTLLLERADRIFVCANPDPASAAATRQFLEQLGQRESYLVVSQADERDVPHLTRAFDRSPAFLLPRDEPACRSALETRGPAGGRLGRAYEAIAEILAAELPG